MDDAWRHSNVSECKKPNLPRLPDDYVSNFHFKVFKFGPRREFKSLCDRFKEETIGNTKLKAVQG